MSWPHDDSAPRHKGPRRPFSETRPAPSEGRPDPRESRAPAGQQPYGERAERPAYGNRSERPSYGDRSGRPAYNSRPERPVYGERAERQAYGDRSGRPSYGAERPAYGQRAERPSYGERAERPAHQDRPRREEPEFIPSKGDADSLPQTAVGGMREVEELLTTDPARIHRILFRLKSDNPKLYTLQKLARKLHIHVQQVEGRVLEQYAVPNGGIVALCHEKDVLSWESVRMDLFQAVETNTQKLIAVVTNIEDPRNLGACIRSSLALGVDLLLMPSKGMCGLTPTVARAAAGAMDKLRICRPDNLEGALSELVMAGYQLVGLDADTQSFLPNYDFKSQVVVAVGGEDRGLPPFIRKQCAAVLRIPMLPDAHSYNASVALSLGLYEIARTRLEQSPTLPAEI